MNTFSFDRKSLTMTRLGLVSRGDAFVLTTTKTSTPAIYMVTDGDVNNNGLIPCFCLQTGCIWKMTSARHVMLVDLNVTAKLMEET
jgi:hypothetical protein